MNQRHEFEIIKAKYDKIGKGNVRVSQSSLIIAQQIVANNNSYKFPITINDGQIVLPNEETRLDINDEFVATSQGFFLRCVLTDPLGLTPSAVVFLTSAPFEKDSSYIVFERLYMGKFNISVNNIVYMQNWDMRRHEYKGITQIQDFSAGIPQATWYANNFMENSMQDLTPMITFSGAKKNEPLLTLPEAIQPLPAAGSFIAGNNQNMSFAVTHIMYFCRGWLAQNAAKFQN